MARGERMAARHGPHPPRVAHELNTDPRAHEERPTPDQRAGTPHEAPRDGLGEQPRVCITDTRRCLSDETNPEATTRRHCGLTSERSPHADARSSTCPRPASAAVVTPRCSANHATHARSRQLSVCIVVVFAVEGDDACGPPLSTSTLLHCVSPLMITGTRFGAVGGRRDTCNRDPARQERHDVVTADRCEIGTCRRPAKRGRRAAEHRRLARRRTAQRFWQPWRMRPLRLREVVARQSRDEPLGLACGNTGRRRAVEGAPHESDTTKHECSPGSRRRRRGHRP